MSKLIILNGGKGCGKSDLVLYIRKILEGKVKVVEARCKDRLFTMTADIFGLSTNDFWDLYSDRLSKEMPNPIFTVTPHAYTQLCEFLGVDSIPYIRISISGKIAISLRHALIYVSELVAKPLFGQDYFGVCRANAMEVHSGTLYVDDSALGSMDEVTPSLERLGERNVMAVRIYGRGDFGGDSRSYLPDGALENMIDVHNDGTLKEYLEGTYTKLEKFIND